MASSTRLSFRPIRRSPVMILTMYLASSGVACAKKFAHQCGFGGWAASCDRGSCGNLQTEAVLPVFPGLDSADVRPGVCGAVERRTSPATAPRSPSWRYAAVSSASAFPESSATIRHSSDPPTCSVVSSQTGNGLPERKTAETAGFLRRRRLQILGDDRGLFEFLGGAGDLLGRLQRA